MAVTRARAVELVETLLFEVPWGEHELVIRGVVEDAPGWIVAWNTAEYARTGDSRHVLAGGGPYLVDRQDGSVHVIPGTTFRNHDRAALCLRQVKGVRPPDALAAEVRALAHTAGAVAAMAHLRRRAPRLSLPRAKADLAAVRDGAEPPEASADLTEEKVVCPPLPIRTVRPGHG